MKLEDEGFERHEANLHFDNWFQWQYWKLVYRFRLWRLNRKKGVK